MEFCRNCLTRKQPLKIVAHLLHDGSGTCLDCAAHSLLTRPLERDRTSGGQPSRLRSELPVHIYQSGGKQQRQPGTLFIHGVIATILATSLPRRQLQNPTLTLASTHRRRAAA